MDDTLQFIGERAEEIVWCTFAIAIFFLLRFLVWHTKIKIIAKKREEDGKGPIDPEALKKLLEKKRVERVARIKALTKERLTFWSQKFKEKKKRGHGRP